MEKINLSQRTNKEWVKLLSGPTADRALLDLHDLLLPCLRVIFANTITKDFKSKTEDFARGAAIKIQEELPTFNTNVKFSTWALKVAIHMAYIDLRHERLNENLRGGKLAMANLISSQPTDPHNPAGDLALEQIQYLILEAVGDYIENELPDRQHTALIAIYQQGLSMEVCARQLGISRDALEALLFEIRTSLRALIEEKFDLGVNDILSLFDWSEQESVEFHNQLSDEIAVEKEELLIEELLYNDSLGG